MPVFQRIQLNSVLNRRHHLRTPLCSPSLGDTSDVRFVPLQGIATTLDSLCNNINKRALIVAQGRMSPTAPSSLPNYLADGLPKQDDETLRKVQEYVDELLTTREQRQSEPVTEDELPGDA